MSIPLPQTHHHPSPLQTLTPHLLPHLPTSLPLLRRIQFHPSSPSAHILATFPPSPSPPPHSFAATYVDRTRAPETECWIFSTHEHPHPLQQIPLSQNARTARARAQLLALLHTISLLPSPTPHLTIGSLHESLLPLLGGSSNLPPQKVLTRNIKNDTPPTDIDPTRVLNAISIPYTKYLIPPPPSQPHQPQPLPPSYTFTNVPRADLALTISRTSIPKTETTLASLGNIGIRYTSPEKLEEESEGKLIAWAFMGVDGSLTSLHVEPAHRGKGLAKAVGRMLIRKLVEDARGMGFLEGEEGEEGGMVHSDVAVGNVESAGVARGWGGSEGWRVRWVSVDLGRVEGAVRSLEKG